MLRPNNAEKKLEPKNDKTKTYFSSLDAWVIQKKLHHHAISETINFWDLIMKTRVVQNQKSTEKQFFYIIGCMSHPEKATSCYLGNYWLLRLDYEDKNCFEPKKMNKNSFFYLRLFKSSRNKATLSCYLRNYRILRLNNADKSCLETKINWKVFYSSSDVVRVVQKKLHHHAICKILTFETWLWT